MSQNVIKLSTSVRHKYLCWMPKTLRITIKAFWFLFASTFYWYTFIKEWEKIKMYVEVYLTRALPLRGEAQIWSWVVLCSPVRQQPLTPLYQLTGHCPPHTNSLTDTHTHTRTHTHTHRKSVIKMLFRPLSLHLRGSQYTQICVFTLSQTNNLHHIWCDYILWLASKNRHAARSHAFPDDKHTERAGKSRSTNVYEKKKKEINMWRSILEFGQSADLSKSRNVSLLSNMDLFLAS